MEHYQNIMETLSGLKYGDSSIYVYLNNCSIFPDEHAFWDTNIIPKISNFFEQNILKRNIAYISMLANRQLLEIFTKHQLSQDLTNIQNARSLFDFVMYEKKHWLNVVDSINISQLSRRIDPLTVKIPHLLQLVILTNSTNHSIQDIEMAIKKCTTNRSNFNMFWQFYIKQIEVTLSTVHFCKTIKPDMHMSDMTIYQYMIKNTFLDTLSCFAPLEDDSYWQVICDRLQGQEKNTFLAFEIISTFINTLILKTRNDNYGEVKQKLLNISNATLQQELMENIFALLFYRTAEGRTCNEKDIEMILKLLRYLFIELNTDSSDGRFDKLNETVANGLWRLQLIRNLEVCNDPKDMLHYMLAPAPSLVQLCLDKKDFPLARQVIETCDLHGCDLEFEIDTAEIYFKLIASSSETEQNPAILNEINATLPKFKPKGFKTLKSSHTSDCTEEFLVLIDLALAQPSNEMLGKILEITEEYHRFADSNVSRLKKFYDVLRKMHVKNPEDSSVNAMLSTIDVLGEESPKDLEHELVDLYDRFQSEISLNRAGELNQNHDCHSMVLSMVENLEKLAPTSENRYLAKVYKYLRSFSKIFYLDKDNSDIVAKGSNRSFFELLFLNRSELTGILLFERNVNPSELEKYFGRLKLDFLYHVVGNCFPTINLHVQTNIKNEDLYHDNMLYTPSAEIINYIQRSNWLLACILCKMYDVQGVSMDVSLMRLSTFLNFLRVPRIQTLKLIFGMNEILTSVQNAIVPSKIKNHFEKLIKQDLSSINSNTGSEVSDDPELSDWESFFNVIESIPENQMRTEQELNRWRNELFVYNIRDKCEERSRKCVYFISDDELRYDTILHNFKRWNADLALLVLNSEISRFHSQDTQKLDNLHQWYKRIMIAKQLCGYCNLESWHKSYNICMTQKSEALRVILDNNNVDLLLNYVDLFYVGDDLLSIIDAQHFKKIIEIEGSLESAQSLMNYLPDEQAINLCNGLLALVKIIEHFQFAIDNLHFRGVWNSNLANIRASIKMISVLEEPKQPAFVPLIREPLTILEVLLMNTRLDELANVLNVLELDKEGAQETINTNNVDALLRQYAEKSLVFPFVIKQNNVPWTETSDLSESKLLQSVDSISLKSESSLFVIPEKVPSKEEWIRNDDVSDCMCCSQVTFSMFNRRHHCRRCGRVVCYGCSLKRMIVPKYGDILVRVCKDCFIQTEDNNQLLGKREVNVVKMTVQENWILNDDQAHNKIVREEFSYEHSPSISLCLSILKYHSKNNDLTKFLVEQCEVMLKIIQSTENSETQEIDVMLVMKMLKSLAMAANISGCGSPAVDRILYQAELLTLLAKRGFLKWFPKFGSSTDEFMLRRLKDKLIECEEWTLALDVATKAGFNSASVFAAWGKNCLEAGSLVLAREKFQRCFEKNSLLETSMHKSESYNSCDSMNMSQSSLFSPKLSTASMADIKTAQDPPLLREIISILETKTKAVEEDLVMSQKRTSSKYNQKHSPSFAPISILNRLKNLDAISSGKYSSNQQHTSFGIGTKIDNVFYEECIYYLKKYGSSVSLLEFYVNHGNVHEALVQIMECRYSADVVTEFYVNCLKNGIVHVLQDNMAKIDPSLDVWKDYLTSICCYLERHRLLNSLYQLQLFIGDYIRASITCVRFYEDNVKYFKDFASNNPYLVKSEIHLKQALAQEQWIELTNDDAASTSSSGEKTLTNPNLVMVIEAKDITKHIETIKLQTKLVDYFIQCDTVDNNINELLSAIYSTAKYSSPENITLPTLFGTQFHKIILATLAIIGGKKLSEGFEIAMEIARGFKIKPIKINCLAGKQLGALRRHDSVLELIECIKSTEPEDIADVDEVLTESISALIKANVNPSQLESLTKLIRNRSAKISAYITMGQLKTAYFLAVKYKRIADVKRIQREAELMNLPGIKTLCQKYLRSNVQGAPNNVA